MAAPCRHRTGNLVWITLPRLFFFPRKDYIYKRQVKVQSNTRNLSHTVSVHPPWFYKMVMEIFLIKSQSKGGQHSFSSRCQSCLVTQHHCSRTSTQKPDWNISWKADCVNKSDCFKCKVADYPPVWLQELEIFINPCMTEWKLRARFLGRLAAFQELLRTVYERHKCEWSVQINSRAISLLVEHSMNQKLSG